MKKLIFLSISLLFFLLPATQAQHIPHGMKYQAVARDLSGDVLAEQEISLKITLYSFENKQVEYSETHAVTTSQLGLFSLTIGDGQADFGAFDRVPWSTEEIWMELAIDESGGNDFATLSNSKLLAVPYAFHAATASQLAGGKLIGENGNRNPGSGNGVPANVWSLFGNSSTDPNEDNLGTTDCADLVIITDDAERIRILCSGEVLIDSDLSVGNDLDVGNNANVGNDLTVQQDVEVNIKGGNTIVHGDLSVVDGSSTLLTGTLNVNGATDLDNTLNVDGTTDLNSSLDVNNASPTTLTGTLNVNGASDLDNTLNVDGHTDLNSTATIYGATNIFDSLNVNNNSPTTLGGTLFVNGAADLDNTLTVEDHTDLNSTVTVAGATNLNSSLNVNNASPTVLTGILNVNQNTDLDGNLNVDGTTDLNSTLDVNNGAATNLSGALTVGGITNLNNNFNVNNSKPSLLTGSLTVNGISNFDNNVTMDKCLQVGIPTSAMLKFNPDKVITGEGSFSNYPLQISGNGAKQGVAIKVKDWAPTSNFMAFFVGNTMHGRIEGKTGFLQQDFSSTAQNLTNYDPNDAQGTAGGDTTSQNAVNQVTTAGGTPVPTTPHSDSQINTEEVVDFVILAVNFIGAVVEAASSFTSIPFDPVDIFEAALGAIVSIADLAVFVGFGVANLGVAYESGSGDYAEWLLKSDVEEVMNYGDVVGVIGGQVSKEFVNADKFMVVSAAPAVVGAMPPSVEEEDLYEKIAFLGQVPVKVRGEVEVGDFILPSGDGDGLAIAVSREEMKAKDYTRIIGVAWEASKVEDRHKIYQMINTAVGINQNDLGHVIDQMQTVMNQMQEAIMQVNPDYEGFMFDTESDDWKMDLDYSVSATHESEIKGYFEGVEYSSREELGLLVKEAIEVQAGIDFSEYPMVEKILLDPEYAAAVKQTYSLYLNDYLEYMRQLENGG